MSKLRKITLKLARITHFPMTIFHISIYLIITVLLNDGARFFLKMFFSGDSYRKEISRASRSTVVCAMGVCTAWHYRTAKRTKLLSLFNLFFFINKFQLFILTDHLNYDSLGEFFFLLEMAVNVNQYRE